MRDGIYIVADNAGGTGRKDKNQLWVVARLGEFDCFTQFALTSVDNAIFVEICDNIPGIFNIAYAPVCLTDADHVGTHHKTSDAALRGVYNERRIVYRQQTAQTVKLLTLQPLTECAICGFNALFLEVALNFCAASAEVVVSVRH
jgi:hypothetical protein